MIFEIKHSSGVIEYAQAKNVLHLVTSYEEDYGAENITSILLITDDEAKVAPLRNTEYDETNPDDSMPKEIMLYDLVSGDDFVIVGSTEW